MINPLYIVTNTGKRITDHFVGGVFDFVSRSCPTATTIVEAGKNKQNPDDFAEALDSVLGDFGFPDVFLFEVWGALGDVKNGRI